MNHNFYLIICYIAFLYYFSITLVKKIYINFITEIKSSLPNNKYNNFNNINLVYHILLVFVVIWINIVVICHNSNYYNYKLIYYKQSIIYQIGIAILFFILGYFASFGKKIFYFFIDNYQYIIKSIVLSCLYVVFWKIKDTYHNYHTILIPILIIICLINFYFSLNKQKNNLKNNIFVFEFIWFLWIVFHIVFVLINNL